MYEGIGAHAGRASGLLRGVSSRLNKRYAPPPAPGGVTPPGTPPQGSSIPGAGLYLQHQALAQQAYDNAMQQINTKASGNPKGLWVPGEWCCRSQQPVWDVPADDAWTRDL
jgi:hypothetical protein